MSLKWPPKDPNERLDYVINWTDRLDGDTIDTSDWTIPVGITGDAAAKTDTTTTIWITGGTTGQSYDVLNRIVTVGGRTMDQTVTLKIKDR